MANFVSVIIPCKGRLHHLKRTLPTIMKQANAPDHEIIVVDYGCPDNVFEWCKTQDVRAIKVLNNTKYFDRSRVRNCGANVAQGEILVFLDADVLCAPDFLAEITKSIRLKGAQLAHIGVGTSAVAVTASVFQEVRGFDERIEGWGREPEDFFIRCKETGIDWTGFRPTIIKIIQHGDDERTEFHKEKNKMTSWRKNRKLSRMPIVNPGGHGKGQFERFP